MEILFGLDISHHQSRSLDLAACRRDGCEFVFIKATEGSSFTDPDFAANLAEARAAGMLVAAYVFVRANATAAQHIAHIRSVVPLDVPLILDIETALDKTKPSLALGRQVLDAARSGGYRVPLSYIPRWYWQGWGSPSLAGMPPLWSSRYPDNIVGTIAQEWADVPAFYWDGYGGLSVAVLQFTSSARIAGQAPLDANAFRGTRAQLAAIFGGSDPTTEEEYVQLRAGTNRSAATDIPAGRRELIINVPTGSMTVHSIYFAGDNYDGKPRDQFDWKGTEGGDVEIDGLRPWHVPVPDGATNFSIFWTLVDDGREGSVTFR